MSVRRVEDEQKRRFIKSQGNLGPLFTRCSSCATQPLPRTVMDEANRGLNQPPEAPAKRPRLSIVVVRPAVSQSSVGVIRAHKVRTPLPSSLDRGTMPPTCPWRFMRCFPVTTHNSRSCLEEEVCGGTTTRKEDCSVASSSRRRLCVVRQFREGAGESRVTLERPEDLIRPFPKCTMPISSLFGETKVLFSVSGIQTQRQLMPCSRQLSSLHLLVPWAPARYEKGAVGKFRSNDGRVPVLAGPDQITRGGLLQLRLSWS